MSGAWDDDVKTIKDTIRTTFHEAFPDTPEVQPLEIVFDRDTHEPSSGTMPIPQNVMLEIWTLNRLYLVDANMICTAVIDRRTGTRDTKHSNLGARLAGGQRRYGKTLHVARPFPVPGTEAVFERPDKRQAAAVTSKVERVVLHQRVTSIVLDDKNAWDDVTSALLMQTPPTPKPRR
ncbi:MAG: hypothetical protein U0234_31080 [Sandaracinus sp.]